MTNKIAKVNNNIHKQGQVDFYILLLTLILTIFGTVMIFSASYYNSINDSGTPYDYLIAQGKYGVLGLIVMFITSRIDYHVFKKLSPILLVFSIITLLMLFTPLGITVNNATRWLNVFGLGTFMPGEFSKFAAIMFTATFFANDSNKIYSFKRGIIPMAVLMVVLGVPIALQPNLSTAITVCAVIAAIMFIAGLEWKWVGIVFGGGFSMLVVMIFIKGGFWLDRLTSFVHPFDDALGNGYQVVQSLLALGTGGLFGIGLGKSIQKNLYLPEPQNDFILAIIGEELGFIAIAILILVYAILIYRCFHVAINAPDRFGRFVASGVGSMIGIQVIFNIAIVTSSMPPTGIILPLVSYGGNALLLFLASIGVVLNISRRTLK